MTTPPLQRFNPSSPCPICGGHPKLPRGKRTRCYGYVSSDGLYAHCTREDHAGPLPITQSSETFAHRLEGECNCGQRHGPIPASAPTTNENRRRSKTLEATYPYLDEHGDLSYQVLRYRRSDGDKDFLQRRPDGNGDWMWKIRGLTFLPYHLPELIETPLDDMVYVSEGEKDVDRLMSEGLNATCNSGGAGKFHPDLVPWFTGRRVALLQDNDPAGHQHVKKLAALLHGIADSIKIIGFPEMPEHGDISDWLDAGHTVDELTKLVAAAPEYVPEPQPGAATPVPGTLRPWPEPLAEEAYHGIVGKVTRAIAPHTEADPAAILITTLVYAGNAMGRGPHAIAEADRHGTNINAVLVGETAKGRKGSADGHIRELFGRVDQEWTSSRIMSGLSSGEGLLWAVRDPIEKAEPIRENRRHTGEYETVVIDQGVEDKRLVARETEFASVLKLMARESNILSALIRQAWDSGHLRTMTKNSPAVATDAHISIMGHVTKNELLRYLSDIEMGNGFANRFLWACTKRGQVLPEGGGEPDYRLITPMLHEALDRAKNVGKIARDDSARNVWAGVYRDLSEGKPGLFGSVTARAEAQVLRLSVIYAALDGARAIETHHLLAALAVWEYAEASARYIFGDATGVPTADRIMEALVTFGEMSRTDIQNQLFHRNVPAARIAQALQLLATAGKATFEMRETGGVRPAEVWMAQ